MPVLLQCGPFSSTLSTSPTSYAGRQSKVEVDRVTATLRFDPGEADLAAPVKANIDTGFRQRRAGERMDTIVVESTLTCPQCGHVKHETMPVDACQFFYECEGCKALLRPLPGDCRVFCSYGSVECPQVQARRSCGG